MIDNYDSFTYNIVQYFEQLGQDVVVWQNDSHPVDAVSALNPDYIVIGPGPKPPVMPVFRCKLSNSTQVLSLFSVFA